MLIASVAFALAAVTPPALEDLVARSNRPVSTYLPIDLPTRMEGATEPMVLYMNRFGGAFACGNDNAATNVSSVACETTSGVASIDAFSDGDAAWDEVMSCLVDLFAPFRLPVTDVEPLTGSYVEAVIGGTPDQAGMSFGVGGVAPFGCGIIPGAVVYAFADVYNGATRDICETAAQEIVHAFGLDHEYLCEDPMTYLTGCGEKSFQDTFAPCGEFEPRECSCGDTTQNSVQSMLSLFGPADGTTWEPPVDNAPPTVGVLAPADGDILPANDPVLVSVVADDDAGLASVELVWGLSQEVLFCPTTTAAYSCVKSGSSYTWSIHDTAGSHVFFARARDIVGNIVETDDVRVWLSTDGSGPPEDHAAPTIFIGAPLEGAVLPVDVPFSIVATIVDDNSVAQAELNWPRIGQDFWIPCPYADERVSCAVDGSTYRWTVRSRRDGERTFTIRAADVLGNITTSNTVGIVLQSGAAAPESDGNDVRDEAATVACGDTASVSATDADWFAVDAPSGDLVTVAIEGEGRVLATQGNLVVGDDSASVRVEMNDDALRVGVAPNAADAGSVNVTVTCEAPPVEFVNPPSCGSCASAGDPAAFVAVLGALSLLSRRRRSQAGRA